MSSAGVLLAERYLIDRLLGQGGFAAVYRATDQALGRTVAIKVLHPDFAREEEARALFLHEARTSATLEHPHILGLHDVGTVAQRLLIEVPDRRSRPYEQYYPQVCYIVMPYIAGGSLADRLDGTPLPPPIVLRYLGQIAAALDFAHAQGIVHRDLKPQNLLLRAADDHLLLADFGIARILSGTRSILYTRAVGTPHYMAPEQFEGRVATASDRYAFGCIAYQLLTGTVPFPLGDPVALMRAHTSQIVPHATTQIAARGGLLPTTVDTVLARALAKHPYDRHGTATDIVHALTNALHTPIYQLPPMLPGVSSNPIPQFAPPVVDPRATPPPPARLVPQATPQPRPAIEAIAIAAPPARRNRRALWFGLLSGGSVLILLLALLANSLRAASITPTRALAPTTTRTQLVIVLTATKIVITPLSTATPTAIVTSTRPLLATSTARVTPTATALPLPPFGTSTVLTGHIGTVWAVAWSPNGRVLASGSTDRNIGLWDAVTGTTIAVLAGHTAPVRSVAWSPDGRTLASASDDGTVRLWDPETGQTTAILQEHVGYVRAVAWSPDGRTLASAAGDKTVRLWDPVTGQPRAILQGHTDYVQAVAWSPDGRTLASASDDRTVRLWDPATEQPVAVLQGHTDYVQAVAWSPDGRTLASASNDQTVRLWDPITGQVITKLTGHTNHVRAVAWSPDGRTLASASYDKNVGLWNPASGQIIAVLSEHTDWMNAVVWSPDGQALATASHDKMIRLWR